MTEPTLPPDIAAAINKLVFWSHRAGETYRDSEVCEKHAARAALEAAILGHLPVWRSIESAPKDRRIVALMAPYPTQGWSDARTGWWDGNAWARWPHSFEPTHWMPLPSPPATDLGRSALAEEAREK